MAGEKETSPSCTVNVTCSEIDMTECNTIIGHHNCENKSEMLHIARLYL